MDKDEIHLNDINRILFGEAPPEFLLEVFFRTLVMFGFCLVIVKWLGKRMNGQISITETTVMITIGALISVPMQFPDRGLLQGFLLLTGMLLIYNHINLLGVKHKKIESLLQGSAKLLVKDSRLELKEMEHTHISRQQLFEQLRNKQIYNLGEVKRVYLEACGIFSVYKHVHARHGLLILPPGEEQEAIRLAEYGNGLVCGNCGFTQQSSETHATCLYCKNNSWQKAAKLKAKDE